MREIRSGNKLIVENSAKTLQGERKIPLGNYLSCVFKMKYQEYINKGIVPKSTDFIFYTKAGNPFYEQPLRKMYKSLAKKLGISEIGCYSLRHEFATYLAQVEKSDQETIKELMGWSEIISTYFHTDNDYKEQAVASIDKQYNSNVPLPKDTTNKNNIIQFPFGNAVNE